MRAMAVRKSVEDVFVVDGPRDEWLSKVEQALTTQGFTNVQTSAALYQADASYKKATVWGTLAVTLLPEGEAATRIRATATANVDNLFAAFSSPGRKILGRFKQGLG